MSTIILTTGQPGSGKSYSRVRWLVKDFLVNNTGVYITNIPINADEICKHLSNRYGKPYDDYKNRLVVIPNDELKLWENLQFEDKNSLQKMKEENTFLPSVFFDKYDLSNSHIAIDEFHLYFCKQHPTYLKQLWQNWFAEIRKLGCTFEAITQDSALLPREFIGKVGTMIDLVPLKNTRDPFFKILMGDWYELRSSYFGLTEQRVLQEEKIKVSSLVGVKWKITDVDKFTISSDYYRFYNSYQRNDNQQVGSVKTPSELYGKKIIFWFLKRNFFRLFGKICLAIFVVWLLFFCGFVKGLEYFLSMSSSIASSNGVKSSSKSNTSSKNPTSNGIPGNVNSLPETSNQQSLQNELLELETQLKIDELKKESLEKDLLDFQPVMFYKDFVYLKNGLKIYVNYKFTGGIYDEREVVEVNSNERCYVLDDDTYVFMFKF